MVYLLNLIFSDNRFLFFRYLSLSIATSLFVSYLNIAYFFIDIVQLGYFYLIFSVFLFCFIQVDEFSLCFLFILQRFYFSGKEFSCFRSEIDL